MYLSTAYELEMMSTRIQIHCVSQQRGRTQLPTLRFPYQCCLLGFRAIGIMRLALGPPRMEPEVTLIVVILDPYY